MSEEERFSLKEIINRNHESVWKKLDSIEAQTFKTNGRVTKVEEWQDRYEPILKDIKSERVEKMKQVRGIFWDIIKIVAVAIFFYLVAQMFPDAFKVISQK